MLMGHGCNLRNVLLRVFASEGADVTTGVAETAACERFES
jgi:hypothetical protein